MWIGPNLRGVPDTHNRGRSGKRMFAESLDFPARL
jgi:hypothetical protein